MKKFKVKSFILESKKWVPSATLFTTNDGTDLDIKDYESPPEYRFNTQQEADNFIREYFINDGYTEQTDE